MQRYVHASKLALSAVLWSMDDRGNTRRLKLEAAPRSMIVGSGEQVRPRLVSLHSSQRPIVWPLPICLTYKEFTYGTVMEHARAFLVGVGKAHMSQELG